MNISLKNLGHIKEANNIKLN